MTVSPGLAFLAGLASFLTPCVFSLMPAYIGWLGGRTIISNSDSNINHQWTLFLQGLAFVLGFSLIFIGLGLTASWIGSLLIDARVWLARLGGLLVILFGLQQTGLLHISWLDYDLRPQTGIKKTSGLASSFMMGICFSAGWSPCVGPILGAILTLAVNEGSLQQGFYLLTAYSAGFAVPFMILALGLEWLTPRLRSFHRVTHGIQVSLGILLIAVGILLFFGMYEQVVRLGNPFNVGL